MTCSFRRFAAGALAATSLTFAPAAQEWTRLRGPKGQGHGVADLPAALSADHVRWRVPAGAGHSSPVLWGDALFLTRTVEGRGRRQVVCFDADTGEERWQRTFEFEPHDQHKLNSSASSTPAVDADGVYVLWTSGGKLLALALDHDGEEDGWGTVGAVALDAHGHVAAATSTGGMTGKPLGRVGDTPIIGAGTWADATVAVSCTGVGEAFIRTVAAHSVAAHHQHTSLEEAAERVLNDVAPFGGRGGLIAVNTQGDVVVPFQTMLMYRGLYRDGSVQVGIGPDFIQS